MNKNLHHVFVQYEFRIVQECGCLELVVDLVCEIRTTWRKNIGLSFYFCEVLKQYSGNFT